MRPNDRQADGMVRNTAWALAIAVVSALLAGPAAVAATSSFATVIDNVQPKIVKIYGAGGLRGLESYQSGFLISADGYVLTVWSYVLDTDYITVTLNDGRRYQAELKGHDPRIEIAILKIDAVDLPYFNLDQAVDLTVGDRVLAFSNLYGVATGDEPASVLHGSVSVLSDLTARKGAFESLYRGQVYVLDAMTNNPGAAGGALTDRRGQLAGILGKELRNSLNNTWLNYAIPVPVLTASVEDIQAGRLIPRGNVDPARRPAEPITFAMVGIVLVPDVLNKTPPFIDQVRPASPADKAGLRIDDLILFVNDRIAESCQTLANELSYIDRDDALQLTVQRGQQLIDVVLRATD